MLKNESVKTISEPEFIDVVPQNDLISKCVVKVLYLGQNKNGSFITKDVAKKMANTLPGAPIVAAYLPEKDDFSDHGRVITIEDGEIKFSCKTVPYGFVDPQGKAWFQKYTDTLKSGEEVEHEYLMTTGYLWTGQYPEIQKVIEEGMPQSMELDEDSLDGKWTTERNSGYEIFIVNDATISKLCILGSDVEPCFEGASVEGTEEKEPLSLFSETKDNEEPEFVRALMKMRKELTYALHNEGGLDIMANSKETIEKKPALVFEESDADDAAASVDDGAIAADGTAVSDSADSTDVIEGDDEQDASGEQEGFAEEEPDTPPAEEEPEPLIDSDEDEGRKKLENYTEDSEPETDFDYKTAVNASVIETEVKTTELIPAGEEEGDVLVETKITASEETREILDEEIPDVQEDAQPTHFAAEEQSLKAENEKLIAQLAEFSEVQEKNAEYALRIEALEKENKELKEYKLNIENQEKDAEIAKYFMLSDEDKADVIKNKTEYSLDDIKSKLALLYVQKNVDFNSLGESEVEDAANLKEEAPITTFSLDAPVDLDFTTPTWVEALINRRN